MAGLGLNTIQYKHLLAILADYLAAFRIFNTAQLALVFLAVFRTGGKTARRPGQRQMPEGKHFGFKAADILLQTLLLQQGLQPVAG